MKKPRRTRVLGLTAAFVASAAVLGTALPAHAVTTPAAKHAMNAAAAWLRGQLGGGLLQYGGGYGDNYGSSIDAALQLAATGHGAAAERIANAVEADNASAYTDSSYDGVTTRSAGGVAKALVLAEVMQDADVPTLVGELEPLVGSNGQIADDATEDGAPDPDDDYANVIGQAYTVWGLSVADPGSTATTDATTFLLSQQCGDGAFPTYFDTSGKTPVTCTTKTRSVDTTATVLLALENLPTSAAVTRAENEALKFLTTSQTASGGFSQTGVAKGVDANSTGLAGWVLGIAGRQAAATKAASWLVAHQVPESATGRLAAVRGAIEYDPATLAAAKKKGWKAAQDQWVVATSQCVAALAYAPKAH